MADDDQDLSSRFAPIITVVILLIAGSLVPKGDMAATRDGLARHDKKHSKPKRDPKDVGIAIASGYKDKRTRPRIQVELSSSSNLSAYENLGSWIDIYDEWPWRNPELAVRRLHGRGVQTIFLQTSNYGLNRTMFKRRQTARFLEAAHRRDMRVVAWTVPSFAKRKVDYHRARAAIKFTRRGHSFDSFGLDIEATLVADISKRNRSLMHLSKRLRQLVGPDYTLAAITPDPVEAAYWPHFPYKQVNRLYDVFVPMGYFSFRTNGYKGVKKYTLASIRNIRRESENPNAPIHFIGGIGGETTVGEVKGFVSAVRAKELIGASYYDFVATSKDEWNELESIVQEPPREPAPEQTAEAPQPEATPTAIGAKQARCETTDKDKKARDKHERKHKSDKKKSKKKNEKKNGNGKKPKKKQDNEKANKKNGKHNKKANKKNSKHNKKANKKNGKHNKKANKKKKSQRTAATGSAAGGTPRGTLGLAAPRDCAPSSRSDL